MIMESLLNKAIITIIIIIIIDDDVDDDNSNNNNNNNIGYYYWLWRLVMSLVRFDPSFRDLTMPLRRRQRER